MSRERSVSRVPALPKQMKTKAKAHSRQVDWVYYESKREPKIRGMNKCRCDERLQTKTKEFTRLPYTGLVLLNKFNVFLSIFSFALRTSLERGKETRQGHYRCRRRWWQTVGPPVLADYCRSTCSMQDPPVLAWNWKSSGSVSWTTKSPFVRLVCRSACTHTHFHMSVRYASVPVTTHGSLETPSWFRKAQSRHELVWVSEFETRVLTRLLFVDAASRHAWTKKSCSHMNLCVYTRNRARSPEKNDF
jgi:hypothetical protein